MTFNKIVLALDGSRFSETAAQYGYWLAGKLKAQLIAQHVVDPRFMDTLLAPEFASEVETSITIEAAEGVLKAIKDVGAIILDLYLQECQKHGLEASVFLDEGHIVAEVVRRGVGADLIIVGHHGRGHSRIATDLITGSIAERISVQSKKPVLIAIQEPQTIEHIVVAFDGSEPSRGALLLGQYLCELFSLNLKAVIVTPSPEHKPQQDAIIEQGRLLLKADRKDAFVLLQDRSAADALMRYTTDKSGCLLIVGAYGFRDPQENVIGSTTTSLVRNTRCSLLVYR